MYYFKSGKKREKQNSHTVTQQNKTQDMHMQGKSQVSTRFIINNDLKPVCPKQCCLEGENDRRTER